MMAKRLIRFFRSALLVFVLLFSLGNLFFSPAFAYSGPPLIYDEAGLLSYSDRQELTSAAEELSDRYQCAVSAVFVKQLNGYSRIQDFADDFYDSNGYGYGATHDGIILVVSMGEREFHLSTAGKAIDIFTDYGLEQTENAFVTRLSAGDYSGAVEKYLSKCEELLRHYAQTGSAVDSYSTGSGTGAARGFSLPGLLASLGFGALLGGTPLRKQKKSLETVRSKANASDYRVGTLSLSVSRDRFINRNITRVPRPKDTGRGSGGHSGGGSSIHFSSSGVSHGGRSGHF